MRRGSCCVAGGSEDKHNPSGCTFDRVSLAGSPPHSGTESRSHLLRVRSYALLGEEKLGSRRRQPFSRNATLDKQGKVPVFHQEVALAPMARGLARAGEAKNEEHELPRPGSPALSASWGSVWQLGPSGGQPVSQPSSQLGCSSRRNRNLSQKPTEIEFGRVFRKVLVHRHDTGFVVFRQSFRWEGGDKYWTLFLELHGLQGSVHKVRISIGTICNPARMIRTNWSTREKSLEAF